MMYSCTLARRSDGGWMARHSGSRLGQVEVSAPTREQVLDKMRNELRYRSEYCPCSGALGEKIELQVLEEAR